jgi:hypothetical protein
MTLDARRTGCPPQKTGFASVKIPVVACLLYFRSGLLKTLEDDLLYSFQYFLGVVKLHVFRKKILGTLRDARLRIRE